MLDYIILIALVAYTVKFAIQQNIRFKFCDFCFGFWICVCLTIGFGYFFGFERQLMIYPFASAPIVALVNRFLI